MTRVVTIKGQGHIALNLIDLGSAIIEVCCEHPTLSGERCDNINYHVSDSQLHLRVAVLFAGHNIGDKDLIVFESAFLNA